MNLAESINDIPNDKLLETWHDAIVLYKGFAEFLDNTVAGVADENGYEVTNKQTHPRNFIDKNLHISCRGIFIKESVWDNYFQWLGLGVEINDNELYCYTHLSLQGFNSRHFDSDLKAKALKQKMLSISWIIEWGEDEELWYVYKRKPINNFDFSKPTWKKGIKRFYEDCLTELTETIFVTKNWLD